MKKVLIIEDHYSTLQLFKDILANEKVEISEASDGEEGLLKAMSEKPDLILLDIMLPGKSGIEVFRELKASVDTAKIKIIVVSVKAYEREVQSVIGDTPSLSKPFVASKLIELVRQALA